MKKSQYGYMFLAEEVATALCCEDLANSPRGVFTICSENWRALQFLVDVGLVEIAPGDTFHKDEDTLVRLRDAYLQSQLVALAKAADTLAGGGGNAINTLRAINAYYGAKWALENSDLDWLPATLREWADNQLGLIASYAATQTESLEAAMKDIEVKKAELAALRAKHEEERKAERVSVHFDPKPYIKPERLREDWVDVRK